jgi:ankyrin repeat protein
LPNPTVLDESSCGIAKLLLDHGANADATNDEGKTALHYFDANYRMPKKTVALLLHAMRDVDARDTSGCTVLMRMVRYSYLRDEVLFALAKGASISGEDHYGRNIMRNAAYSEDTVILQALLDAGADINDGIPLAAALGTRNPAIVTWFLDHGADPNPHLPYNQTLARSMKYETDYKTQAIRTLLLSRGGSDTARR